MDPYSGVHLIARAFHWNGDMDDLVDICENLHAESREKDKPENEWALRVVCEALLERPGLPELYRGQLLLFLATTEKGDILAMQERLQEAKTAIHTSSVMVCPVEFDSIAWASEEKKLAKTVQSLIEQMDVAHAEALAAPDGVQPDRPRIMVQPPEEPDASDTSKVTKDMEGLQLSGVKGKNPDTSTKAGGLKPYPVLGSMRRNAPPSVRRKQSNQFFLGQGIAPALPVRPVRNISHSFAAESDTKVQKKDHEGKGDADGE